MPFEDAVTRLTGNNGGLFGKTMATGLALLLLPFILPACAARHMPDWSRVQAVSPKTKTEVQLYKDEVPQGLNTGHGGSPATRPPRRATAGAGPRWPTGPGGAGPPVGEQALAGS